MKVQPGSSTRSRLLTVAAALGLFMGSLAATPTYAVTIVPRPGDVVPTPERIKDDAFTTPETYASGTIITTRYDATRATTDTIAMSIGNSAGGSLNVVNLTTEKNLLYKVLENDGKMRTSKGAYVLPNRQSLLGTNTGEIYHVNPNNLTVRKVPAIPGPNPPTALYGMTGGSGAGDYDVFVGGNNGHVYLFDFGGYSKGTNPQPWTDLGEVAPGDPYVFDLGYDDAGTLYAGVGTAEPALWRIPVANPALKTKMVIPGNRLDLATAVTQAKVIGRYLYVTYDAAYPNQATHVYSLDRNEWIDKEGGMFAVTKPRTPGLNPDKAYFRGSFNRLSSYDPRTAVNGVDDMKQVITTSSTMPGQVPPTDCWTGTATCITVGSRGDFYINDTAANTVREISPITSTEGQSFYRSGPKGTGITTVGPDGRIYMGSEYFSPQYLAIDPKTDGLEYLNNGANLTNGQIEGMAPVQGKLILGSYRPAKLAQYDPTQPQSTTIAVPLSPNAESDEQARPHAIVDIGGGIAAVGTMPEYDVDAGAVAFYDTVSRSMVGFCKGIVHGQAIASLAHRDGAIFGGSSTNLGRSGAAEEPAAALFRLNSKNDTAPTVVVQDGVRTVFSLGFTESGRLYAAVVTKTGQAEIREINPVTLIAVRTLTLGSSGWVTLVPLTSEGLAVMGPYHRIYAVDTSPAQMVEHFISEGIRPQVATNGRWYFGKDGDIFALTPTLKNDQGNVLDFRGMIASGSPSSS